MCEGCRPSGKPMRSLSHLLLWLDHREICTTNATVSSLTCVTIHYSSFDNMHTPHSNAPHLKGTSKSRLWIYTRTWCYSWTEAGSGHRANPYTQSERCFQTLHILVFANSDLTYGSQSQSYDGFATETRTPLLADVLSAETHWKGLCE